MSKIKVGDNVRYLNSVGGGVVKRVEGKLAYVDEDGFETPVLLTEIVAVGAQTSKAWNETKLREESRLAEAEAALEAAKKVPGKPEAKIDVAPQPVIETPGGDLLNITLGFEPNDIKRLSQSGFSAYLVNDSNYTLSYALSSRSDDDSLLHLRSAGTIEPNFEQHLFDLQVADLVKFERISLQVIAYKQHKDFKPVLPIEYCRKLDVTKFAKLHCFKSHRYFDGPVLACDIVKDGRTEQEPDYSLLANTPLKSSAKGLEKPSKPLSKPSSKPEVIVTDLHATELLDTTAGLSPADILNYQIDTFRKVMDSHLRIPGMKLIFIHGKGNGVLRNAINKELAHRYKQCEVSDASFAEYGFGATAVTIHKAK